MMMITKTPKFRMAFRKIIMVEPFGKIETQIVLDSSESAAMQSVVMRGFVDDRRAS